MSIEAWVTDPAGTYIASIDRSEANPYRKLAFSPALGASGVGSLEYNLNGDQVAALDDLFAFDNLVWMKFRGKTFTWTIEERETVLDEGESASDWVQISGRGTRQLIGDRTVWPSKFSEATTDPLQWGVGDYTTTVDATAAGGQKVVPVTATTGASVGIPVEITGGGNSQIGIIASIVVGVSITLVDNLAFTFGVGSRVVGAAKQWRRFVNRPAGEMLWDCITESNPRFAAQIVRGTVETTGTDGYTKDLRFDNLLDDVVADVEALYGDVEMQGLTFNYRKVQGVDRTATVILEEGADLRRLTFQETARDTLSWVVLEGTGEAVYAKLKTKEKPKKRPRKTPRRKGPPRRRRAPEAPKKVELQRVEFPTFVTEEESNVTRRREAYVEAKDVKDPTLLDEQGRAILEEHVIRDAVTLEAIEDRFEAITHYDLGDWIRVMAPSRGADEDVRIVAMYIVETDDEQVRVAIDVNTRRTEHLLNLNRKADQARSSIGVRNRQPQGNLLLVPISDTVYFDSTTDSVTSLWLPDELKPIVRCRVAIDFDQYPMPVSAAASSGSLTSDSGGGSTSGASSASSSGADAHEHLLAQWVDDTPAGDPGRDYAIGTGAGSMRAQLATVSASDIYTQSGGSHSHTIAHTHTTPAHQHTVPGHVHSLTAASTKESYPASHSVTVKIYELVDTTWTIRATLTGYVLDREEIDLLPYITGTGRWRITLQSASGQPNGGRIGAHLSGYVLGATQSA